MGIAFALGGMAAIHPLDFYTGIGGIHCSLPERLAPGVAKVPADFSMIFSACVIFGVDMLFLAFLIVAACLVMGLGRVMGGN